MSFSFFGLGSSGKNAGCTSASHVSNTVDDVSAWMKIGAGNNAASVVLPTPGKPTIVITGALGVALATCDRYDIFDPLGSSAVVVSLTLQKVIPCAIVVNITLANINIKMAVNMLSLCKIKEKLKDRRVEIVAKETGLHYNTVRIVRDDPNANPTYRVIKALSDYLECAE